MQKAKRQAWLILNQVPFPGTPCLCSWCKFSRWSGDCEDGYMECEHPLDVISENSEDVSEGRDCWGFRPNVAPEDAADIVGMWLRGEHPDWSTVPRMGRR